MSFIARALSGRPVRVGMEVGRSIDFERVDALPRRPEPSAAALRAAAVSLRALGKGTQELRPIQAWALNEIAAQAAVGRGLLAPMGVGAGKTLVSLLAPVFYEGPVVLFTYASLLEKTRRDMNELATHWHIPADRITLQTWESLSRPDASHLLSRLAPRLIVADEVHAVKDPTAARTARFLRYFEEYPDTKLVALSGTITSTGLRDFAHIAALCLGNGAPVPLHPAIVTEWGAALDTGVNWAERRGPGALASWMAPGETSPRDGFRRRLVETFGVVATSADALGTGLNIEVVRRCPAPELAEFVARVEATGQDPDGNELEDPGAFARVVKTASLGFWLRWAWPNGVADTEWLSARNAWNRECRRFLADSAPAGLDSPGLLAAACAQGNPPTDALATAWEAWEPVSGRPPPPVVARFDSCAVAALGGLVRDWAKGGGGIVWVGSPDIAEKLSGQTGIPNFPAGADPSTSKAKVIIASIQAHGTGKNLQRWNRNLVLVPPSGGKVWEQLLGRTHRPGQTADTVEVTVWAWNPTLLKSWKTALSESLYIQQTTGSPQKLQAATITKD